jgi:cell division protein FtsW (lipid II flippase)
MDNKIGLMMIHSMHFMGANRSANCLPPFARQMDAAVFNLFALFFVLSAMPRHAVWKVEDSATR